MKIHLSHLQNPTISAQEFETFVRDVLTPLQSEICIQRITQFLNGEHMIAVDYISRLKTYVDDLVLLEEVRKLLTQNNICIIDFIPTEANNPLMSRQLEGLDLNRFGIWNREWKNKTIYSIDPHFAADLVGDDELQENVIDSGIFPINVSLEDGKGTQIKYMGGFDYPQTIQRSPSIMDELNIDSHAEIRNFFDAENPYHLLIWAIKNNTELGEELFFNPMVAEEPGDSHYNRIQKAATMNEVGQIKLELLADKMTISILKEKNNKKYEKIFTIELPEENVFKQEAKDSYISRLKK